MAQAGGVHMIMYLDSGVDVRVCVGVLVGSKSHPPYFAAKETITNPRRIARNARMLILVLDLIHPPYGFGATIVPMAGTSRLVDRRGSPFSISTGTQS